MVYVWTEKAELRARELKLEERKAGEVACYGEKPVSGQIAEEWLKKGYIEEKAESIE